jgi:hypothetical protein
MSPTKPVGRVGVKDAAWKRNDALIGRAARRADWAVSALEGAAGDLTRAHGPEGNSLTGITEIVRDQAERLSSLADDIERCRVYQARPSWKSAAARTPAAIGSGSAEQSAGARESPRARARTRPRLPGG